jgi:deoxyadenosine/deoxycytidine kinase
MTDEQEEEKFRPYTRALPPLARRLRKFVGQVFVIEGPIGAGKTTLGHALTQACNEAGVPATFFLEAIPHAALSAFILFASGGNGDNTKKNPHAFALQMAFLACRQDTYERALALAAQGHVVFIDRSLPGDYAIARTNYELGNFTDAQWAEYKARRAQADLLEPSVILYLDTSLGETLPRIKKRSRDQEDKYDPAYLEHVVRVYKRVMAALDYPVVELPWDKERHFDDPQEAAAVCLAIFNVLEEAMYQEGHYRRRVLV